MQRWAYLVSAYLARIGDSRSHVRQNEALFLKAMLGSEWIYSSSLPFVLAGVRSATESDWRSVLQDAFRGQFWELVDVIDYGTAGHYVRAILASVDESDRIVIVIVIVGVILGR